MALYLLTHRARMAALSPAGPPPTTITSQSYPILLSLPFLLKIGNQSPRLQDLFDMGVHGGKWETSGIGEVNDSLGGEDIDQFSVFDPILNFSAFKSRDAEIG